MSNIYIPYERQGIGAMHRDNSMHIERANMLCQAIAPDRLFYISLISTDGEKLECF